MYVNGSLQNKYREEYEKNKGQPYNISAETPEMIRIKKAQEQLSEVRRTL